MKQALKIFLNNFLKCGLVGWCMEILFTGMGALRRRDMTLKGFTSLWMFPIYGCAAVLAPIGRLLRKKPFWLRGTTYMGIFYSVEYLAGRLLEKQKSCPWDYSRSRWNIGRVIRLDFAPCWFGAGLIFEHLLTCTPPAPHRQPAKTHRP